MCIRMLESEFIKWLPNPKIKGNRLDIGKYAFDLPVDVTVLDEHDDMVLKGKLMLDVYEDCEDYVDHYHLGFIVKMTETNGKFNPYRITLPDLLYAIHINKWKLILD